MVVYTNVDMQKLEYRSPAKNKMGGTVVYVSTVPGQSDYLSRLRFQMSIDINSRQEAVWDASAPPDSPSKKTLELSIPDERLLNFLNDLDKLNKQKALESCAQWFPRTSSVDADAIEGMYQSIVKQPDKNRPKNVVRIKIRGGDFYPTKVWRVISMDNGKLKTVMGSESDLRKGSKVMAIVETPGLWFMSRQFGMSLTASDVMVWPSESVTGISAFSIGEDMEVEVCDTPNGMCNQGVGDDDMA